MQAVQSGGSPQCICRKHVPFLTHTYTHIYCNDNNRAIGNNLMAIISSFVSMEFTFWSKTHSQYSGWIVAVCASPYSLLPVVDSVACFPTHKTECAKLLILWIYLIVFHTFLSSDIMDYCLLVILVVKNVLELVYLGLLLQSGRRQIHAQSDKVMAAVSTSGLVVPHL